ncbi:hypothetical protein ACVWYN_001256 [Pedobacter sp. UYP24]
MAVIKNGILGGFSGKAGTVNGYHLMGQEIMRGPRRNRTSKVSPKEVLNRNKFAVSQVWLQPLTGLLRIGFQFYKPKCHGFVAAKSFISKNAMVADDAGFHVDPALACISHGPLSPGMDETATLGENYSIDFTWDYQLGAYNDRAMVLAYDIEGGEAEYETSLAKRAEKKGTLKVGHEYAGKTLHIYIGFVSEDRKSRSISKYLGTIMMPEEANDVIEIANQ